MAFAAPHGPVAIIGTGRVGSSMRHGLLRVGREVVVYSRSYLNGTLQPFDLARAETILLCVPDRAITEVAAYVGPLLAPWQVLAHCSGAMTLAPLRAVTCAQVGSLHPLRAIPKPRTDLGGALAVIDFLDGDGIAKRRLRTLAQSLGMQPTFISSDKRALYHAASVIAANGAMALLAESAELFVQCGMTRSVAKHAALGLLLSAHGSISRQSIAESLTGPIARGDVAVVRMHLEALEALPTGESKELYRALGARLLPLSRELGEAEPSTLDQIEQLLETPTKSPAVKAKRRESARSK